MSRPGRWTNPSTGGYRPARRPPVVRRETLSRITMSVTEQRLVALEMVVRALHADVQKLRAEVARLGEAGASAAGEGARAREDFLTGPPVEERDAGPAGKFGGTGAAGARVDPGPGYRSGAGSERASTAGGPPPKTESTPPPYPGRHPFDLPISKPAGTGLSIDIEDLVGRYGTMLVAAVLVVMGVGAFVTWAASRFVLGPEERVALGALLALVLAVGGRVLARRGSPGFGNTLLALALAVVHVDAWAAGPALGLVPSAVALGAAAIASVALAALAMREDNQLLFGVGVLGALLAPFVTGDEEGSVLVLLGYGFALIASALAVVRQRDWKPAGHLLLAGSALYGVAGIGMTSEAGTPMPLRLAVAAFPLLLSWVAFAWGGGRVNAALPVRYAGLALVMLAAMATSGPDPRALVAVAVAGTISVYLHIEKQAMHQTLARFAAFVLPLGFMLIALSLLDFERVPGAIAAGAWTLGAGVAALFAPDERRPVHLLAGGVALLAFCGVAFQDLELPAVTAFAAAGVVLTFVARRADADMVVAPAILGLVVAILWSHDMLNLRPGFAYVPFVTEASLAALIAVAAAFLAAWIGAGREATGPVLMAIAGGALFLWGRSELERAWSADAATFALILYYAAFGVAALAIGRVQRVGILRGLGLALALYAALKAVMQATTIDTISLRVASYLLVGGFLLGVGFWYRGGASPQGEPDAA